MTKIYKYRNWFKTELTCKECNGSIKRKQWIGYVPKKREIEYVGWKHKCSQCDREWITKN